MVMDRELAKQHIEVMTHVEALGQLLEPTGRTLTHAHTRRLLLHHLGALHRCLVQHFAAEEEDGYFADLRQDRPHLETRIEALRLQHAPLLVLSDRTLKRAPHANVPTIREDVRTLMDALRRHEAGERAILQDAVLLDIGVGD